MMSEFEQRFAQALESLKPASTLVVGVSGGLDSMALLELLRGSGQKIIVAHFNHQLRGDESDSDEAFVREQAGKRGLEFRAGRGDVRAHAKGISIEMAARKLRHAFLAEVARDVQGDIVLAHHADDQIELVLMRARRGVEGYGASGMREKSSSPAIPSIRLLRPLLRFRKSELQAFVEARKIPYREDSSNSEIKIERNRVRHTVIPILREQFGPDFETQFLRHIETTRANDDWWREAAHAWLYGKFRTLPERMQKEIVVLQLEQRALPVTAKVVDEILASQGKIVTVARDKFVSIDEFGRLEAHLDLPGPAPLRIDLHSDGPIDYAGGKLDWAVNNVGDTDLNAPGRMVFDAEQIGHSFTLRPPGAGDRVRLSGRGSERPLFDVLARNKIPKEKRKSVVVAETKRGEIFWVEGLRILEDFKVTDSTDFVLEWRWTRD